MRWIVRIFLLVGAALVLTACHENGVVFDVDTAEDAPDALPGDGICATAGGGCTLRAAIMEANALPGVERIDNAGIVPTSFISAPGPEDDPAIGDFDITEQVVIDDLAFFIWAAIEHGQLFDVNHPTGMVEIRGAQMITAFAEPSAAIRLRGTGALWIEDAHLSNWEDRVGTMIESDAGAGALGVVRARVSGFPPSHAANGVVAHGSSLTVQHSTFSNLDSGIATTAPTSRLAFVSLVDNVVGLSGAAAVQATVVARNGLDCDQTVTTLGDNVEAGTSCGFTAPSDHQSTHVRYIRGSTLGFDSTYFLPAVGSPGYEHPMSAGRCSGIDALHVARPNGAACEVGGVETVAWEGCSQPIGAFPRARFCDLPGLDVSGGNISETDLAGGGFVGANFSDANVQANFHGADLTSANFSNSFALAADFTWSDLTNADFTGADATQAHLDNALLVGTDFTDANLQNAIFDNATMSGVIWSNTICPSGINSDDNGGDCTGQL